MSRDNAIPLASLALWGASLAYLWTISGQPRMADGGLSGSEMSPIEMAMTLAVPLATFATMFVAMRRAYWNGSRSWLLACLFLWPLAYVYTLLINRTDLH
ncbi:hypothetical protein FB548_0085 [Pseudoxanthomonas sp. 3HH-4]|uniref:hypothetical protein n=1 Tax=Pseudoxanthomonas sp. 3HH-4 TaxID=1690214 RepID=UPI00114DA3B6|nr:hypothetical protein [Pseudoxanthomonas sp. 3HH-4]TQM16717.1 hypothetical protein FB548_0085 [Pseudoxanthomonas sp. 3HH-4]